MGKEYLKTTEKQVSDQVSDQVITAIVFDVLSTEIQEIINVKHRDYFAPLTVEV